MGACVTRRMPPIVLAAVLGFAACEPSSSGSAREEPGVEVRDSAGIRIVVNTSIPAANPSRVASPVLEIGTIDGPVESQLYRVEGALRHDDGRIFVANSGTADVRIYGPDGNHLATFGGAGDGPSEFRSPNLVQIRGDTVFVQDGTALVLFTDSGEFLDRRSLDLELVTRLVTTPFENGGWQNPETYMVPSSEWATGPPVAGPPFRTPITFFAIDVVGGTVDTITTVGNATQQYVNVGGGQVRAFLLPYFSDFMHGPAGGGYVIGDTGDPAFHRLSPSGDHSIVRWSADPEPISEAHIRDWIELQRGRGRSPERQREMERVWSSVDEPRTMPFYSRVVGTSDGTSWVLMGGDRDGWHWMRFDDAGRRERDLMLPFRFSVLDAGADWVLGLYRDDLDVEYLRMYSLPPR